MTVYNKLKIAILAIISSQSIGAIILDPIQIQSGSGDLLYAEMKFHQASPDSKLEVGLADPEDLMTLGVSHKPPGHLNFFTRRSSDGSGVIVITSSRPVTESELNILVKIKEGNATRIQQVKAPLGRSKTSDTPTLSNTEQKLTPQMIVSEKDIALNLPVSTQYQPTATTVDSGTATASTAQLPAISISAPPTTSSTAALAQTGTATTTAQTATVSGSEPVTASQAANPAVAVAAQTTAEHSQKQTTATGTHTARSASAKSDSEKSSTTKSGSANQHKSAQTAKVTNPKQQHVVRANESLWKIASQIAAETNQSIPAVMRQIKASNEHAFIQGDANRIRQGVAINLAAGYQPISAQKKAASTTPATAQKQSGKAKYKLNQAEMSIVAETDQNAGHGTATKGSQQNRSTAELSAKVMTAREKTVKLQQNVSQLALSLQQKNHRIQLLNSRLAQLQQQLQQQNHAKKSAH
ncbi:type IV pilus assembly protein FimV [Acinetobacter sp. WZC-1]|uniref:type IV pilus assembly protein FimV n=1 Tax=Acinetobacter sp. WZC-1 TaxID=3459034 RepID=UPI00403DCF33